MKTLLLISLFALLTSSLFSQVSNYTDIFVPKEHFHLLINNNNSDETMIKGTSFSDTNFTNGSLLIDGNRYDMPMRYNIYLEAFELKHEDQYFYVRSESIDTVYYQNSLFVFNEYDSKIKVFEVIYQNGGNALLKKHITEFIPESVGVPFKDDVYPHFTKKEPKYFFSMADMGLIQLFSFKTLNKYYPDEKNKINSFIKKNKLKKDNKSHLISLLDFISSMP